MAKNPKNRMMIDSQKTVMRKVYILSLGEAAHRFIPIDECGTCDVDGQSFLLKAARNMWDEFVRTGYVFTSCDEVEKPLYTRERTRRRKQRVKSGMTKHDSLYREAEKAAKMHDMELQEARIDPRKFFKEVGKRHPLNEKQCYAINAYDKKYKKQMYENSNYALEA